MATEALVFVLSKHLFPNAHICLQHCLSLGYHAIGIVKDDWNKAMGYLADGTVSVVVVADERDLEPARTPRVEIVSHVRPHAGHSAGLVKPGAARHGERTHIVKRTAEE